ncbi:MAG: hypothetical protein NC218_00125 [Acetobacter sp.]|nr:hypothetical protein [Acetobacter sp.]
MNKFFMGCLSVAALALMIGQAVAGGENSVNNAANAAMKNAAQNAENNGVLIIETYTASAVSVPNSSNFQPVQGDPGVEAAPLDSFVAQPVLVEEDMLIQETEAGE